MATKRTSVVCRHIFDNHLVPANWDGDVSSLSPFPLAKVNASIESNIKKCFVESQAATETHLHAF